MDLGFHLRPCEDEPLADSSRYRHHVRSLVYLAIIDISYVVRILSLTLPPLYFTTVAFFVFFITFSLDYDDAYSSLDPALFSFMLATVMRPGPALFSYCVFLGSSQEEEAPI